MNFPIAVGANIYKGYSLERACRSLSKIGIDYIDIDFIETSQAIKGNNKLSHISFDDFDRVDEIKTILDNYGLKALTFSGHVTLLEKKQVENFIKKMRFAKKIGANYISTGTVPENKEEQLYKNIDILVKEAKDLGIKLCLETEPKEVISDGRKGLEILNDYNSSWLYLTYDFGNTFYANKGEIDIIKDFENCLEHIGTLHIKDVVIEDEKLSYCTIGEGNMKFPEIFDILKNHNKYFPITLEIPYYFYSSNWSKIVMQNKKKSIEEIEHMILKSKKYVEKLLL